MYAFSSKKSVSAGWDSTKPQPLDPYPLIACWLDLLREGRGIAVGPALRLPVVRGELVDNVLEGRERAEGLVALPVLPGRLAARDGDRLVVVAEPHVVALDLPPLGLREGGRGFAADARGRGARLCGAEEGGDAGRRRGGAGLGVGGGPRGAATEELDGDVAGERGPGVVAEGAEAG